MRELGRMVAMAVIFAVATAAWMIFGAVMSGRTSDQQSALRGQVADLWGQPLVQQAPTAHVTWSEVVSVQEALRDVNGNPLTDADGTPRTRAVPTEMAQHRVQELASTRLDVDLALDARRKGLTWFSLYDVDFDGSWSLVADHDGTLVLAFPFPTPDGVYDDFRFEVDGVDRGDEVRPQGGVVSWQAPVTAGQKVAFAIRYRSRGLDDWTYRPFGWGEVGQLKDFHLDLHTDFGDIDFPSSTLSPSARARDGAGWTLAWDFERLVTGHGMGMEMPQRVQAGPLAASMSFSAPLSLGLFMVWIHVLSLLHRIDIHPMNHLFLAAAFFSFHLLFGYSADHLPVEVAFGLAAVVSVGLVTSYLRLVVGPRFAFREAGVAQLLYLVGFSLAHFWDGLTGLTLTALGVVTLFALMQLTGRVRWSSVFEGAGAKA